MSSLKQKIRPKAKTSSDIQLEVKILLGMSEEEYHKNCKKNERFLSQKWVRLEDANDQTMKVVEQGLKALLELKEIHERERGEQKQKLRQLAVETENLRRHNQYNAETDKWLIPQRQLFALEKQFEELLRK